MAIKDAKLQNTIIDEMNQFDKRGLGKSPLNSENEEKSFYRIGFDYLTFTIPYNENSKEDENKLNEILKLMKLDIKDADYSKTGFYGYHKSYSWPTKIKSVKDTATRFMFDGALCNSKRSSEDTDGIDVPVKTGCFELSGDCCRDFERRCGELMPGYWFEFFDTIFFKYQAKFSRFDLCIDLFNSPISILDILNAYNEQRLSTPLHKFSQHLTQSSFGEYDEISLYIGSMGAEVCINIYDKKLERNQLGLTVDFDTWYRIEFRFRQKKATNMMLNLLREYQLNGSISDYVSKLLLKYIDIKDMPLLGKEYEPGYKISKNTINKWPTNDKWIEVIGGTETAKVINFYQHESKIVRIASWESRSVSKANLKLYLSDPASYSAFMRQMLVVGMEKELSNSDLQTINEHRIEKGYRKLTRIDLKNELEELQKQLNESIEDNDIDLYTGEVKGIVITPEDLYK